MVCYKISKGQPGSVQTASIVDGDGSAQDGINLALAGAALIGNQMQVMAKGHHQNLLQAGVGRKALLESTKGLRNIDKFNKSLGYIGMGLTAANLGYKYLSGDGITRQDAFDAAVTVALSFIAISNPAVLIGLGVYGLLDSVGALMEQKSFSGLMILSY